MWPTDHQRGYAHDAARRGRRGEEGMSECDSKLPVGRHSPSSVVRKELTIWGSVRALWSLRRCIKGAGCARCWDEGKGKHPQCSLSPLLFLLIHPVLKSRLSSSPSCISRWQQRSPLPALCSASKSALTRPKSTPRSPSRFAPHPALARRKTPPWSLTYVALHSPLPLSTG